MTFFENIRRSHGHDMTLVLKEISKLYTKLAMEKNRRIFLTRCKHLDIYPKFLNFNTSHLNFTGTYFESKLNNIINKTKLSILNLSIKQTTRNINEINRLINQHEEHIKIHLPVNIAETFINFQNRKFQQIFEKIKIKQQNKIQYLVSGSNKDTKNENITSKWLDNISDTLIPNEIAEVLSLGPNFALDITTEKELPTTEYIASIESVINDKSNEEKDTIRANITNIITNHKTKIKNNKLKMNTMQKRIKKNLYRTKQFIKDNPQVVILKPDKTNKTVIMNTKDYESKMETLLNDQNTYKKLKSDPTNIYQKKNNAFIKKLLNKNEISNEEAKMLIINNAVSPKIYGLPKMHKQNIPLRPIVSCLKSPLYNLSKYLAKCISNITGNNDYFIKDSFTFKEFIDTITIPQNYKLLSLDVVSLYTNIPKELVQTAINKKWDLLTEHTTISKNNFIEAVNLTLNTNYFQYQDKFYQQVDGCAMGSPISSVIAQLVMEHLEECVINNLDYNILFFKRFVDDCLLAVPSDKTDKVLHDFNSFHQKLQFTSEIENNNEIHFLDTTLIRKHNKIITKWYTKPTWSGRYLNFYSNHTKAQKVSVVVGLTDRAIALTSPNLRPKALDQMKSVLIHNGFREKDINQTIKARTYKFYNKKIKKDETKEQNQNKFLPLPYIRDLSEKLKSTLKKYNITVCHKTQNKLNSLFTNLKSQVPTMNQSNIVYSIPCADCPMHYIGMTTQLLKNRLNGHKYTKNATTALHKHTTEQGHDFNFNETKILNRDINTGKLAIKEMIEIKKNEKFTVNDKSDIKGISHIYTNLIR